MRNSRKPQRGTYWYRALGRLHRYTDTMRHLRRSSTQDRTEEDQLTTTPPSTTTGPTDPEVFNARRPTPRPSPPYDVPGSLATITPTHLLALLHQIEGEGVDIAGNVRPEATGGLSPVCESTIESPPLPPRPTQLDRPCPPPEITPERPERPESTGSLVETTYVQMSSSRAGTRGSTAGSTDTRMSIDRSPPSQSETRPRRPLEPESTYEDLNEPGRYSHTLGERTIPIPQGSPPCRPPPTIPTPAYYKDYGHPDVFPAYRLICHSVWYVQMTPDVIVCAECSTAEHAFCASNRPLSVWRHLHVLSREFVHTTMHCGRCYKLLITTRRAIDCYQCRQHIIDMHGHTDRLVYKVMCESVVPRNIA